MPLAQRPAAGGRPADLLILPRRNRVVAGLAYLIYHALLDQRHGSLRNEALQPGGSTRMKLATHVDVLVS